MRKVSLKLVYGNQTPEEFERCAKVALGVIAAGGQQGWDDLRIIQEIVMVGIPREFGARVFHAKQNRYPPAVCVRCDAKFRHSNYFGASSKYCKKCKQDGAVIQSSEARARDIARSIANVAVKRGKLTRKPCSECGAETAEKHHHDYSKPLEVTWLCRPCHMAEHKRLKSA